MKTMLIILILLAASCKYQAMSQPIQTINQNFEFELEKYLGKWYEIARFDHRFERNLQGVTASYSLMHNGKIEVINQGYKNGLDGKLKKAKGKARVTSDGTPRNLEVSFFLFFYSPYNILELDENYTYALIGSESADYLWILSRTPQMDETAFKNLIEKAEERGYDTSKLIMVEQAKE